MLKPSVLPASSLHWRLEEGPSASRLLSGNLRVFRLNIGHPSLSSNNWVQRVLSNVEKCIPAWVEILTRAELISHSAAMLGSIIPEFAAFSPNREIYDQRSNELRSERHNSHKIFLETPHPAQRMKDDGEVLIPYQFVFDVDVARLPFYISQFRSFNMMRLLLTKVDADEAHIADGLRECYLDKQVALDDVMEEINFVAFFDYAGEQLCIETMQQSLCDELIASCGATVTQIPQFKGTTQSKHIIWWGKHKLFEW